MGIIVTIEGVEGGYIATLHKKGKPYEQTKAVFQDLNDAIKWIRRLEDSTDYTITFAGSINDSFKDAPVEIGKNDRSLNTQVAIALDLPYGKSYTTNPTHMMYVIEALATRKITVSILQEPYREKLGNCEKGEKGEHLPYYTVSLWSGIGGFRDEVSKTCGTSLGYMVCTMAIDILKKIKDKEKKCQ